MATVVECLLPLTEFPLGTVIERDPSRRIELERIVPARERLLPFFWVWGPTDDDLERQIRETRAVRALEEVSRTAEGRLYRARWNEAVEGFVRGLGEVGGTIMLGRGTSDGWRFELRFSDRDGARRFQSYCRESDVDVELGRVYTVREGRSDEGYRLTDEQRDTIRRAYERGYFEQPQGVTQTELAEEFGVSQRAISRRLHRGLSRLVGSTVAADLDRPRDRESSGSSSESLELDGTRRDQR